MRCIIGQLEKWMIRKNEIGDTDHLISLFEIHVLNHLLELVSKYCVQVIWRSRQYCNRTWKPEPPAPAPKTRLPSTLKPVSKTVSFCSSSKQMPHIFSQILRSEILSSCREVTWYLCVAIPQRFSTVVWSNTHTDFIKTAYFSLHCLSGNYPDGDCSWWGLIFLSFMDRVDPNSGQLDMQRTFAKCRWSHKPSC